MGDGPLEKLDEALHQLARVLDAGVRSEMSASPWNSALLDVRFAKNGMSWLSKIRVVIPGLPTASVDVSTDIDLVLIELNDLRSAVLPAWYGIKMELQSSGEVEVRYDYNSDCSDDASFYED